MMKGHDLRQSFVDQKIQAEHAYASHLSKGSTTFMNKSGEQNLDFNLSANHDFSSLDFPNSTPLELLARKFKDTLAQNQNGVYRCVSVTLHQTANHNCQKSDTMPAVLSSDKLHYIIDHAAPNKEQQGEHIEVLGFCNDPERKSIAQYWAFYFTIWFHFVPGSSKITRISLMTES